MRPTRRYCYLQLNGTSTKLLPAQRADFRVVVTEQDEEIIVMVDLIPGVSKKDITLSLVNPQALEISCEHKEEKKEESVEYYLHERSFGSMTRFVPLPKAVTEDGSTAKFRNDVPRSSSQEINGGGEGKNSDRVIFPSFHTDSLEQEWPEWKKAGKVPINTWR